MTKMVENNQIPMDESPAQKYVRLLRTKGHEEAQEYVSELKQEVREKEFKKSFEETEAELKKAGFETSAAEIYVKGLRGKTPEQILREEEPERARRIFEGPSEKELEIERLKQEREERKLIRETGTPIQKAVVKAKDIYREATFKVRETKITPTKTYGEVMARAEWGWEKRAEWFVKRDSKLGEFASYGAAELVRLAGRQPLILPTYAAVGVAGAGVMKGLSALGPVGKGVLYSAGVVLPATYLFGTGGILPATYGVGVIPRYKALPTPKAKVKFAVAETAKMVALSFGGIYGEKMWSKAIGYVRTRGMEKIIPEKAIAPEVIAGKKLFPSGPPKIHYREFISRKYQLPGTKEIGVWHAASQKQTAFSQIIRKGIGKEGIVGLGKEYLPGGFVSPSLSPYFLKISPPKVSLYGFGVTGVKPTALYIYPKGIKTLRGPTPSMWKFLTTKAQKGYAYIPGKKTEIEALIPPGTKMVRVRAKYYSVWEGVRFPIYEYKPMDIGKIKGISMTLPKIASRYAYTYKPTPSITPGTLASMYAISKVTSYKPYPYKISKPYTYKYEPYKYEPYPYKPVTYKPYKYEPTPYKPYKYEPYPYKPVTYKPYKYEPYPYKPVTYKPYKYEPYPYKPYTYKPYPYRPTPYTPGPPPLIPFKFDWPIEKLPKKKRIKKLVRKFKYRPTITAAHYGLHGFKVPKYLTGLEHRPIISR